MATVNVCGLTLTKATDLAQLLRTNNIDVLGVTETHEGKCTAHPIQGYTYMGKPRGRGRQGGGVGFYVSDALLPLVQPHLGTAVHDSMWLVVRGQRSVTPTLCLGLVYLPPSALSSAAAIAAAYAELQQDINAFSVRGRVCLMGDFNSRVGRAAGAGDHVGQWGEHTSDAAGAALRALLAANDLFALNGRESTATPAYTRDVTKMLSDGSTRSEQSVLDYLVVPRELAFPPPGSLQPACALRVEPRWQVDSTDHLLLWCPIPHQVSRTSQPLHTQCRPNTYKLTTHHGDPEELAATRQAYEAAVEEAMDGYLRHVAHLETQVSAGGLTAQLAVRAARDALLHRIMHATDISIGFNRRSGKPTQQVHTPAVRAAVEGRRQADEQVQAARQAALQAGSSRAAAQQQAAVQQAEARYVQASRGVKQAVAAARVQRADRTVQQILHADRCNNGAGVWVGMHRLNGGQGQRRGSGPAMLEGAGGITVVEPQGIADTLAQHFQTVTDPATFAQGAGFDAPHQARIESLLQQRCATTSYTDTGDAQLSQLLTCDEVAAVVQHLTNGKAPSPLDGINHELLKYGGDCMHRCMTAFFNLEFTLECKALTPGVIRPLHKKGSTTLANNYRPITLGSTLDKVYNSILNKRVYGHLERTHGLHEAQQGFRVGRGAVDNVLMLKTVLDARKHAKLDTFLLFVDIEKAYDTVWRAGLMHHVWEAGIKGRMFRVLHQMCANATTMVLRKGCMSPAWQPGMGWEQGDTLATTMFSIHVNSILTTLWDKHSGVPVPNTPLGKLVALMFADDLVAAASTSTELQHMIDTLRAELQRWRMKASVSTSDASKTAAMFVPGKRVRGPSAPAQPQVWSWGGVTVPVVQKYKYLGVWVTADGKWEEHRTARFASADKAAHGMYRCMTSHKLPWAMRKIAFTGAVCPTALYASEVWCTHTKVMNDSLDSWQMQKVASMVHCPPTASHACMQQELGIMPLHAVCMIRSLTYWHRVQTLPDGRLTKQIANAWQGKQNPWLTTMHALLRKCELPPTQVLQSNKPQFKRRAEQAVKRSVHAAWTTVRAARGAVLQRYNQAYQAVAAAGVGKARGYFEQLTRQARGAAAELMLKLRIEVLHLNAMHTRQRERETAAAQRTRELCPCCKQTAETAHHFLLQCPTYSQPRTHLLTTLRTLAPAQHAQLMTMQPAEQWRQLLNERHWNQPDATAEIATFLVAAWKRRGEEKEAAAARQLLPANDTDQTGGVLAGFSRPGQSHANTVTATIHPSPALHDPVLTGRETNGLTASGVV